MLATGPPRKSQDTVHIHAHFYLLSTFNFTMIFFSSRGSQEQNELPVGILTGTASICQQQRDIFRCCLATKLCLTLCNSMDCSPPGSFVHGISSQEHWNGLPFPSPGHLLDPGIKHLSPTLAGRLFTPEPPGKPHL